MMELVTAFTLIMVVSASYYLASKSLAPAPRREGEAVEPYMCGEKTEPLREASPPYPWLLLLFAAVEAVPVAVLLAGGSGSISALLFMAAGTFSAITARSMLKRRHTL